MLTRLFLAMHKILIYNDMVCEARSWSVMLKLSAHLYYFCWRKTCAFRPFQNKRRVVLALVSDRKRAKEVHPSGSAIKAEKKGTSSVALQVPFWATWASSRYLVTFHERKINISGGDVPYFTRPVFRTLNTLQY